MLATSGRRSTMRGDRLRRGGLSAAPLAVAILLAGAMASVAGCGRAGAGRRQTARPNVLLVVIDALRADRLHCYGDPRETSPTLDKLAGEGVLFSDVMAQGAETLNSVPLLLTGRRPGDKGMVWREAGGLRYAVPGPECPTLPELLKRQGYTTGMISANPVLRVEQAVGRGFDTIDAPYDVGPAWVVASSEEVNRRALPWLDRHSRGGAPFFLYVHYLDPHGQYRPPPAFCVFGRPGYTARDDVINAAMSQLPEGLFTPATADTLLSKGGLSRRDVARLSDLYEDEVLYSDHCVGELLDKLRGLGLYDNTLIVVAADHGDAFLEHGDVKHRASLYQELLRVPLIIRGPGVRGGRREDHLVENVDVAPTILEAVGVAAPAGTSGHSLYGALARGESLADDTGFAEIPLAKAYAVRQGKWKLITSPQGSELYDLSQDPGERRNLRSARPEEVDRLRELLRVLLSGRSESTKKGAPLSQHDLEVLRSLGYVK